MRLETSAGAATRVFHLKERPPIPLPGPVTAERDGMAPERQARRSLGRPGWLPTKFPGLHPAVPDLILDQDPRRGNEARRSMYTRGSQLTA